MKTKLSLLTILALSTSTLSALQFQTVGYKSISMGGAGVASSSSSAASYNNPALLAKASSTVEVSLGLGTSTYDHGAGASVQALEDSGFMDALDDADEDLDNADVDTLFAGKDVILDMDNKGVELSPHGYIGAQVYNYGFGVFTTSNLTGVARVSQEKDRFIFENEEYEGIEIPGEYRYQELLENGEIVESTKEEYDKHSIQSAMDNGETYFDTIGVAIAEVPLAYGHKLETSQGNVYIGGAVKYMQAITYTEQLLLDGDDEEESEEVENDITSSNFGIDLGIAYEPNFAQNLTLAMVAKNLNSPEFDVVNGKNVVVDPMVRMGVAYNILESLEVAADLDLTSNKTYIPNLESQMFGAGINYQPVSWFSARAGLMSNLDENDKAGMIYTLGLGLGVEQFYLDLSAQMSSNSQTIDIDDTSATYPHYAKVNLAIVSRW